MPQYVSSFINYARYLINFTLETHRFQYWEMYLSYILMVSFPSFGLFSPMVLSGQMLDLSGSSSHLVFLLFSHHSVFLLYFLRYYFSFFF